jgi:serine/threonine protein kinase
LTDYVDSMCTFDPTTGEATSKSHASSLPYSPPEKFTPGAARYPAKTDVFSMAVTAHEILLGKRPDFLSFDHPPGTLTSDAFDQYGKKRHGQNRQAIESLLRKDQVQISEDPAANAAFHALMLRAMEPNPEKRCGIKEFNQRFAEIKKRLE